MDNIRLCFRRINRWAQSFVARRTMDTELTPSQIQALRYITYHGTMSQQELVEDMGVDKAAVTRLVAGLEELGYVTRTDEGHWALTPKGYLISNSIISDLLIAQDESQPLKKL